MPSDAQSVINGLVTSFQKVLQTHENEMKKLIQQTSNRKAFGIAGKTVRDLQKRAKVREYELKNAEKGLEATKELNDAFQEFTTDLKNNKKSNVQSRRKTVASIDRLVNTTNTLSGSQINQITKVRELIANHKNTSSSMASLSKIINQSLDGEALNYKEKLRSVKVGDKFSRSIVSLTAGAAGLLDRFFKLSVAVSLFGEGLVREFSNVEHSLKTQTPAMDLLRVNSWDLAKTYRESALSYGLSTKDIQETQDAYRQAILSSSGPISDLSQSSKKLMDQYRISGDTLFKVTGSVNDSLKELGASMDLLSYQGVKMTMNEMTQATIGPGGLVEHFKALSIATGQSYQQLVEANKQMLDSKDMQMVLLGLGKKQKAGFVDDLAQRQLYLVTHGMEIKQAQEATAAFAKLTNTMSPKDRYKEAVKLSVLGQAMGINTKGLINASMHPNAKGSQEIMSQFGTQWEKIQGARLNSNNLGTQLLAGAFEEKGQGNLLQAAKGLSTANMESRALSPETEKAILESSKNMNTPLSGVQSTVAEIAKISQQIANILSDPVVSMLGGVIAGIGSLGKTLFEIWAIQKVMGGEATLLGTAAKLLGKGGGGMLGLGGLAGGATTVGAAGAGSLLGTVAAGAGIGYLGGTYLTNNIPKMFGSDRQLSDMIGEGLNTFFNGKYDPNKKLTPPAPTGSPNDPVVAQKQLTDVITNLTKALTDNNDLTNDQKNTISDQIKIAKEHINTLKQNTDATKNNTQSTQMDNKKMSNTDQAPTG